MTVSAIDPLLISRYRRRHPETGPIPPAALRARSGSLEIDSFATSGAHYVEVLQDLLEPTGRTVADFRHVLDLACGCGRILVPLWRRFGDRTAVHGCDIDRGAIEWLRRNHAGIDVEVNHSDPPLPYGEASFDLVYSISLFTHLSEPAQDAWLREVRRVLAPGGVALLTIHGERALRGFVDGETVGAIRGARERLAARSLAEAGFVYEAAEPSRWNALRFIGTTGAWGLAFHTDEYVRERWGRVFPDLDVRRSPLPQDVVVVRG